MDKVIVTSFTIIAALICAVVLFKAVYPAVYRSSAAMTSMESRVDERLHSQVKIIHTSGELDSDQMWQDTNGNGVFDVFMWVKNLGSLRVAAIDQCDVFFGPEGDYTRVPYQDRAGSTYPYWTYEIENGNDWDPTCTLKITVHFSSVLSSERYYVKVVIPNGISDTLMFSL